MIFEFTHAERPVSSWISGVYYNKNNRELAVTTRGNSYVYEDVPFEVFQEFTTGYSAGDIYNSRIRGSYTNKHERALRGYEITLNHVDVEEPEKVESKKFVVRATVEFETEVLADSLDEAVKMFLDGNKDVPGIKIKEVVVPFGE